MSTNSGSRCLKTFVRLNVFLIVCGHISASNANFTAVVPLATGGSWKKSPVTTNWTENRRFRMIWPICASLSKSSPSTIDTGRVRR
ncbi:hypothetical protein BD414DRAFT_455332 [Trametes punicea]|nr:hypothetical protein BD414DRAFT_455332 [Trametes punicea]